MGKILRWALGLVKAAVTGARLEGGDVVVSVRPYRREALRCPVCGRRCACHDHLGMRRWRAMDLGMSKCWIEYRPARVSCPEHGVHEERVPWARAGSRFTRGFEDWTACLAVRCTASSVARIARIEWHTVGSICSRVYSELEAQRGCGRFDGLTREQRRSIEVVTADGARWIRELVKKRCPNARWVMDPFHVVEWMNDALDEVRREEWQAARMAARQAEREARDAEAQGASSAGRLREHARRLAGEASRIKGSRYALAKNPEDLTARQKERLSELRRAEGHLARAWTLKEDLRAVFHAGDAHEAEVLLDAWLKAAAYCRIAPVVAVEKKVRRRREDIIAAVDLDIGNGRVESINNKIKVTVRMGYGFRNIDSLVSLLMLRCSDLQPAMPWEDRAEEARKIEARRERDRERSRKRRKERAASAA